MIYKVSVFTILLMCCFIKAKAQCVPESVFYIYLENSTLSWASSGNCNDTSYIAIIYAANAGEIDYSYQGDDTLIDISFLPFCRIYIFSVSPVSANIVGPYSQIRDNIPLPEDTDIIVENITSTQIGNSVLFQWAVLSKYRFCIDHYKLLLWDEDNADPQEIDTHETNHFFSDVPYCMTYRLDISVVEGSREHPISQYNYTVPSATNNLYLQTVAQGTTTINTTWAVDEYSVNRCEVRALHISGTGLNLTIPLVDSPERPVIDINIGGLQANSMYYFNFTVQNVAGVSRPFQLAVQTLPIESGLDLDFEILDSFDSKSYLV